MTTPFFIVSSGRSGTAMLVKALSAAPEVTVEHEYMVHIVQPLAVRRYRGLVGGRAARDILTATHGAALRYAQTALWGDSSNKLSWLVPELAALFPDARFVHLVRDGRKVASSYFHKLSAECYDDRSTRILAGYLADPAHVAPPPPEKKYWWPQPLPTDADAKKFAAFDQFARICWHWAEINRVIARDLAPLAENRKLTLRLEDLRDDPVHAARLFSFLGLAFRDEYFSVFARPHNVNRPVDTPLTAHQADAFERIAGRQMACLGYAGQPEYAVHY